MQRQTEECLKRLLKDYDEEKKDEPIRYKFETAPTPRTLFNINTRIPNDRSTIYDFYYQMGGPDVQRASEDLYRLLFQSIPSVMTHWIMQYIYHKELNSLSELGYSFQTDSAYMVTVKKDGEIYQGEMNVQFDKATVNITTNAHVALLGFHGTSSIPWPSCRLPKIATSEKTINSELTRVNQVFYPVATNFLKEVLCKFLNNEQRVASFCQRSNTVYDMRRLLTHTTYQCRFSATYESQASFNGHRWLLQIKKMHINASIDSEVQIANPPPS